MLGEVPEIIEYNVLQLIRKKLVQSAKESIRQQATNLEIYGRMHEVFLEMDHGHTVSSLLYINVFLFLMHMKVF